MTLVTNTHSFEVKADSMFNASSKALRDILDLPTEVGIPVEAQGVDITALDMLEPGLYRATVTFKVEEREPEPATECEVCVHSPHDGDICEADLTDSMGTVYGTCQCNGEYIPKARPEEDGIIAESEHEVRLQATADVTIRMTYEQALELVESRDLEPREWDEEDGEWLEDEDAFITRIIETVSDDIVDWSDAYIEGVPTSYEADVEMTYSEVTFSG